MTAVHISARVTRIVQHLQRPAVFERTPEDLSFPDPALQLAREQQSLFAEESHDGRRRPQAIVGLEEEFQSLLHLLVWIQDDTILVIPDQSDGEQEVQLSPAGLVQQSPLATAPAGHAVPLRSWSH